MRQITLTLSGAPGDYIDVPSIAYVINRQSIFVNNLDLSNFLLESELPYFDFYLSPVGLFCKCCKMSLL